MGRPNRPGGPWYNPNGSSDKSGNRCNIEIANNQRRLEIFKNTANDVLSGLRNNDPIVNFQNDDEQWINTSEDILTGGLSYNALSSNQGNDTPIDESGTNIFAMQQTAGFEGIENFSDNLLLGELQFEQISIQQQDTLISDAGNSPMLLKSLNTTRPASTDIVTAI